MSQIAWLRGDLNVAGPISKILFVCTGNICRSPFAQGLFNKLAAQKGLHKVTADSGGLLALPDRSATSMARRVAEEYGVDLTGHRAKSVSKKIVARSDLILVMQKSHEDALLSAFPEAAGKVLLLRHFARHGSRNRGISDPYGLSYEPYRFCFLDIEDPVSGLIQYLAGQPMAFEPVDVACYAGYKSNESPRAFVWRNKTYTVTRIVDRWYEGRLDERSEATDYFKVEVEGGGTYTIRRNRLFDSWAILIPRQTH